MGIFEYIYVLTLITYNRLVSVTQFVDANTELPYEGAEVESEQVVQLSKLCK